MAYERNNRGRVFTHSRDEFGDFGAFGDDIVIPSGVQPWECVLVPECVVRNERFDVSTVFPRYYWSTHITGKYASGAVAAWLRSLGCNPLEAISEMPAWVGANTFFDTGIVGNLDQWNPAWTLADGLVAPGDSRHLAIDGYKHGLCVWPPVAFRDQVHLDAWLAHHESWRYGFDGSKCDWPHLPGYKKVDFLRSMQGTIPNVNLGMLNADVMIPPGCDLNTPARSFTAGFEKLSPATIGPIPCPAHKAIQDTYREMIEGILRVVNVDNEVLLVPGNIIYFDRPRNTSHYMPRSFHQANFSVVDQSIVARLAQTISTLYTLTCTQMAYYMDYRGYEPAFPSRTVKSMYCDRGVDVLGIVNYAMTFAHSLITMNAPGAVGSTLGFIGNMLRNQGGSTAQLPWHSLWTPVAVPVSYFVDWPLCKPKTVPKTAPAPIPSPIPLVSGVRQITDRSGRFLSPEFIAKYEAEHSSLPMLAALGLGGYLLWRYLNK